MTFFPGQDHGQDNVKIAEALATSKSVQSEDHRTGWSKGIKEFEATVRKRNCLMMIRTGKIQ